MDHFPDYNLPEPSFDELSKTCDIFVERVSAAQNAPEVAAIAREWDEVFKESLDWKALIEIRFEQDTTDETYKSNREHLNAIWPKYIGLQTKMKEALLASPFREDLASDFGTQAFELWQCDADSFDSSIEDDLAEEAKLESKYTELLGGAQIEFDGKKLTLSDIQPYRENPDRSVREGVIRARSQWFSENRESLDSIYDGLVKIRSKMATKLGFDRFTPLGYLKMRRIGYGPDQVAAFREEVIEEIVPLAEELCERQAKEIEVDTLMYWDLEYLSKKGNPAPLGDHDWMIDRAKEMFGQMGHGLDAFFDQMVEKGLLDLKTRKGKAPGGFCAYFYQTGMPFIFANFNGTKGDVDVFTHEMGHAFQSWSSRNQPLSDLVWPTTEACEIHSMGLEFLTWPQMDLFYGQERAEDLRKMHLAGSLRFIPYGVSVDHFQHLVYDEPEATPDERAGMWRDLQNRYLPWHQYSDLPCESSGRLWQGQLHIYGAPFYYIDYTLALTGALQFWRLARENHNEAMERYVKLCQKGGSLPYAELLKSVGFRSPFEKGALKEIVRDAREYLLG